MLTDTSIRDRIWKRTGLSSTELREGVINEGISGAIKEFNRHKINTVWSSFSVTQGETDYQFPENVVEIVDVLYPLEPSSVVIDSFSFEDLLLIGMLGVGGIGFDFGGNPFENPSLVQAMFSKLRQFREAFGDATWRILPGNPQKIRLSQAPLEDGTAFYEGSKTWALADILPSDEETFLKGVMWKIAESRAMKLAVVTSISDGTGVSMQPAFKFWQDKADAYEKEFLGELGAYGGTLIVG